MSLPRPTTNENLLAGVTQLVDALERGIAGKRIVSGVSTVTWPGGTSICTELTVTHGLGATPVIVLATVETSGQGQVVACHAGAYTLTTFKVQADFVQGFAPGAGVTLPVAWLALA